MSFLETERVTAGWRFFLLWVLMTNVGFLTGIAIELLLFKQVTFYIAILLSAFGQAWVINRHICIYLPWAIGTILFWYLGDLIASNLLSSFFPNANLLFRLIVIAALAGLLAGIPQWFFMRYWLKKIGMWWIPLSSVAWAILLPGIITGFVLMQFITANTVPIAERRFQLSGDF